MSAYANAIWNFISYNRYYIVVVIAVLIIGVFDENSVLKVLRQQIEISQLEEEIATYREQYENTSTQIREMNRDAKAMRKVARERFFMKEEDEDIFQIKYEEQ